MVHSIGCVIGSVIAIKSLGDSGAVVALRLGLMVLVPILVGVCARRAFFP